MRLRRGGEILSASRRHQEPETQGGDSLTPRGPKDPGAVVHQDTNVKMGRVEDSIAGVSWVYFSVCYY